MRKGLLVALILVATSSRMSPPSRTSAPGSTMILLAQGSPYQRGDLVQLQPTQDRIGLPSQRVIAVPGDRIRIGKDGVFVNDVWVSVSSDLGSSLADWSQTVPGGHYFLISEHVEKGSTTRFWGLLPAERIMKRVAP